MAKKKSGLDMSVEARAARTEEKRAEMEKQGCPFGRYPNGTPRTRPEIPAELRSYYVVYGINRGDGGKTFLNGFRSKRRADDWVNQTRNLLKMSCTAVEIVRSKRVDWKEFE